MKNIIQNLLNKYKNMSLIAKAGIWFVFCTMLQKGVAFITVPIFTRIMPTSEYGIYSTYLSWYAIITVICTLDMHNGIYMNNITKAENEEEKDFAAIPLMTISSIITTVLLVLYLIFRNFINELIGLPTTIVLLMFLEVFLDPVINFWLIRQKFEYKYRNVIIRTVLIAILNAVLGIIFVLLSTKNQAIARIISIVIVQVIFGINFYIYFLKRTHCLFSLKDWKHILSIQLPLLPHSLSLTLLNSADRIMINSITGPVDAAIYSVAYSAAYVINILKNCIMDAIRPEVYKNIKEKKYKEINDLLKKIGILIFAIIVVFMLLAPEVMKIMASEEYYDAIYIIPPVSASTYFTFLYSMFACISLYNEKTKKIMFASIIAAITNIILNYIFIFKFGYLAAGYTTLVCYILLALMHYIIMKQITRKEMKNIKIFDEKFILVTSVLMIVITVLISSIYNYSIIRYFILVLIIAIIIIFRKKIICLYKKIK